MFPRIRNRRGYLTVAVLGSVAATLVLVGLLAAPRTAYELDQVMAQVRGALQLGDAKAGRILKGQGKVDEIPVEIVLSWDGEGRFLAELSGGLNVTYGHDGTITWEQSPTGATRRLELGDRSRNLTQFWILTGFWAAPDSPFKIGLNSRRSTRDAIALDLQLDGSNQTGTIWIDHATGLPTEFVTSEMGQELKVRFENWASSPFLAPRHLTTSKNGRPSIDITFGEPETIAAFPAQTFAQRSNTSKVKFAADEPAQLELVRGRWGHLFVKPIINGKRTGWFAIDTGANGISIDHSQVERLGLTVIGDTRSIGLGGESKTTLVHA